MEVKNSTCEKMRITDAPALDPIDVYFDELGDRAAHVTIICYGSSWTTYFSAPGDEGIKSFIAQCNASYLLGRFENGADKKRSKKTELYLLRIIEAVLQAVRSGCQ